MSASDGLFVVLEGADGCGKSTQARRLVVSLAAAGCNVLHVRDPGATHLAEGVRRLLLDPAYAPIGVRAETLLYLAARAQLAEEVIAPALAGGRTVVCERWTLSTEVYQGLAGGLGQDVIRRLAPLAEGSVVPDLVVVLDVAIGEGLARVGGDRDRMESKSADFHADVVRGYRDLATERERHVVVAAGDEDAVAARILDAVSAVRGPTT